ncbi:MAG: anaerobic ribonucleoside-triphosphate reductase activating protein [Clostridia bacterium]|nr:anaerobic ribonucleoside-triphosphate reductase activating protein [Clostridia bacterium]
MKICGIEKFSMVDWDTKIVCTLFASGCNFRCPFCHNASLALSNQAPLDENEIFDYLEKRKGLLDGVCVSGGEPTLSHDLEDFIGKIKALGYKVKLDTNGTNPTMVQNLINKGLVDYIAMDIKNSPEKYATTTGLASISLDNILESVRIIKSSGIAHEFRTTIIKEFHTENDLKRIADIVVGCDGYFLQQYVDRDSCISHGFTPIDKTTAENWLNHFIGKAKHTSLRGY